MINARSFRNTLSLFILLICVYSSECFSQKLVVGAENTKTYFPHIQGKKIAITTNKTGIAFGRPTALFLKENGFDVKAIFVPEHGYKGTADAGTKVGDQRSDNQEIPIFSLYGNSSKYKKILKNKEVDVVIFDMQDVGTRFYTYYISMLDLMNRCGKSGILFIVLDRPNPNGFYVDGPLLDMQLKSVVGKLPIPLVHGMTLGELARMINGEHWLDKGLQCRLLIAPCIGYDRMNEYIPPVAPSPNLPDIQSIYRYPSTCLFEGTAVSVGRGTANPFRIFGHPDFKNCPYSFIPKSRIGALNPKYKNERCYGFYLEDISRDDIKKQGINLDYLITCYKMFHALHPQKRFFNSMFDRLAGVSYIRTMIKNGESAEKIKKRWEEELKSFKEKRTKYLLY